MAGKAPSPNALISTKPSDTPVTIQLHPLVLLTISDYVTRHTLRSQKGPVIGGIIGQQNGRNFTLEHAFECKLNDTNDLLDEKWFLARVEDYKDVHKAPALDMVAIFMLAPSEGPQAAQLPALVQAQTLLQNEGIMLLLFHPDAVEGMEGGKLPISLYEPFQEPVGDATELRFRELSFEVETGEAEMIGIDFVAKGGGNATAVPGGQTASAGAESSLKTSKGKGKGKAKDSADDGEANGAIANALSPEDEELIASLTAKTNAIKMLNQRINLIRAYLTSLPTSYLTDATSTDLPPEDTTNYPLLRNINSLLSRLPLLGPSTSASSTTLEAASDAPSADFQAPAANCTQTDVHLTSLLATLTRATAEASSLAAKYKVVSRERGSKDRTGFGGGLGVGGRTQGDGMMEAGGGF